MAFKDLQREVLEEFAEAGEVEERADDAGLPQLQRGSRRRASKKQESKSRSDFLAKITRRRYVPVAAAPLLSCAVCRREFFHSGQLYSHFGAQHERLEGVYRPALPNASLGRDRARLARLERQLAAARDLTRALEEAVVRLASKLRGI